VAKLKTCRVCKLKFEPVRFAQVVCHPPKDCVFEYANKKTAAKIKKQNAKQKREFKANDKPLRAKEAQKAFNAYIRARDSKDPCISCQRFHEGQNDAGHFRGAKANPELRFEELNCHKQCSPCNRMLSGNIEKYRVKLVEKIGQDKVNWLEGPHELKKLSCSDYKEIEQKYKQKLKELE